MFQSLLRHRRLILQLTRRNIEGRYRGSLLGVVWALLTPLAMLAVYTFVFTAIFPSTWDGRHSVAEFALILYCGLVVFQTFSDSLSAAPSVIVGNPNYVKKVVFPLETLAVSTLLTAVFHSAIGLAVLLAAQLLIHGGLPWTVVFVPLFYVPLLALTLGLTWALASLGVFLRDIGNLVPIALQALLFLTPVFWPLAKAPQPWRGWLQLNPMAGLVEGFRGAIVFGRAPQALEFALLTLGSLLVMALGWLWFARTRKAFADVL